MYHLETNNQAGFLVLIDFEKAFDSISWQFLYIVLDFFGCYEKFIKWIKLFNIKINGFVLQCGTLSKPIDTCRGCRQGNPIAAYLFILAVEILKLLIDKDPQITGIKVGIHNFKVAQFADDTTLFLDGTSSSLQASLNVPEKFGTFSGLKMNSEKTKTIWIGWKSYSKDKLNVRTTDLG